MFPRRTGQYSYIYQPRAKHEQGHGGANASKPPAGAHGQGSGNTRVPCSETLGPESFHRTPHERPQQENSQNAGQTSTSGHEDSRNTNQGSFEIPRLLYASHHPHSERHWQRFNGSAPFTMPPGPHFPNVSTHSQTYPIPHIDQVYPNFDTYVDEGQASWTEAPWTEAPRTEVPSYPFQDLLFVQHCNFHHEKAMVLMRSGDWGLAGDHVQFVLSMIKEGFGSVKPDDMPSGVRFLGEFTIDLYRLLRLAQWQYLFIPFSRLCLPTGFEKPGERLGQLIKATSLFQRNDKEEVINICKRLVIERRLAPPWANMDAPVEDAILYLMTITLETMGRHTEATWYQSMISYNFAWGWLYKWTLTAILPRQRGPVIIPDLPESPKSPKFPKFPKSPRFPKHPKLWDTSDASGTSDTSDICGPPPLHPRTWPRTFPKRKRPDTNKRSKKRSTCASPQEFRGLGSGD
ncbi:hypothetical protein ABW19_dt0208627 [Dactylella cylindrospora]|nr:hypothetical protein ABW19_dt0208627 [Dactylella cylindrospora]